MLFVMTQLEKTVRNATQSVCLDVFSETQRRGFSVLFGLRWRPLCSCSSSATWNLPTRQGGKPLEKISWRKTKNRPWIKVRFLVRESLSWISWKLMSKLLYLWVLQGRKIAPWDLMVKSKPGRHFDQASVAQMLGLLGGSNPCCWQKYNLLRTRILLVLHKSKSFS